MNNIERLRNYFLGKDPQLKETMADNSLRLIGIPGKEFVLKAELYKRLTDLKKQVDDKDEELQANIDAVIESLSGEQEARMADDEALQRNIDREAEIRNQADTALNNNFELLDGEISTEREDRRTADTTLQGNIDAEARARSESDTALADNFELLSDEIGALRTDLEGKADAINFTGTDGVTDGTSGLVPAPETTDVDKYLKSDGTWESVAGGIPELDYSPVRIWDLDSGIYRLKPNSLIKYKGATDDTNFGAYGDGCILIVSYNSNSDAKYWWIFSGGSNIPAIKTLYIFNGYTTQSTGVWYQFKTSSSYEESSNKVTAISSSSTNTQYPSAKAVYDYIEQHGGGTTITYGTEDLIPGVSELEEGALYFCYE